jgi:sugar (pentulose or hexulose) kinase
LAAAVNVPVSVGDVAAEGGAWGIAVLAAFLRHRDPGQSLADYLARRVFLNVTLRTETPAEADLAGFEAFIRRYVAALPVERAAVEHL